MYSKLACMLLNASFLGNFTFDSSKRFFYFFLSSFRNMVGWCFVVVTSITCDKKIFLLIGLSLVRGTFKKLKVATLFTDGFARDKA